MVAEPPGRRRPFLVSRLGADRDFLTRVELADRHGIAPSALDGRAPAETTVYEHDQGGRLVRSVTVREPAYTEADVAKLTALAVYRDSLCPACGGPLAECTSHEATGPKFRASYLICRRRDALSMAQHAKESERPEAQVWSTHTMRRRAT
jgi:hypothetical protein